MYWSSNAVRCKFAPAAVRRHEGMGIPSRISPVLATLAIVASCGGRAAAPNPAPTETTAPPSYELWVVDQGETTPTGGVPLYIYKRPELAAASPAAAYRVNRGDACVGGGGANVIDYQATPMKTIATLAKAAIGPQSCCATFVKDTVWTTAQGGATTTTTSFNLYQVTGLPDKPVAKKILSRIGNVESHSVILVGQYLWVADRFANTLHIVDQTGDARTMSLASGPLAGRDPAPDIMALSPDASTVFVALRGKTPVTSNIKGLDNAVGDVGGFAILSVKDGGRDATVSSFVSLPLAAGASVVDPHGLRVRLVR